MNLITSPAAQMFWGSIARHALTGLALVLVHHGYVSQAASSAYVEELVGGFLVALSVGWDNRVAYYNRAKMLVALMMPKGSTEDDVNAHVASKLPLPSINTPSSTAPGVPDLGSVDPKRFTSSSSLMVLFCCVVGWSACVGILATSSACALNPQPPAGTYTAPVTNAYNAGQLIADLNSLGQTARNLNAVPVGQPEHLTDMDTMMVRDASLIAGAGLYAWGQGATTLGAARAAVDTIPVSYLPSAILISARAAFDKAVTDHGAGASALFIAVDVYHTLRSNIPVSTAKNPKLAAALAAVDAGIAQIPVQ